jgi:hypothetical protein
MTGSSGTRQRSGSALRSDGFVHVRGALHSQRAAWSVAAEIIDSVSDPGEIEVIGEFVLPPPDGPPSRAFQTLHVDFGIPFVPATAGDVARFTALHILAEAPPTEAATRLVKLDALLSGRGWPGRRELHDRFLDYGRTHGAWDDEGGYVEGSLARMIEAAAGADRVLPSVKSTPGFRCGMEFTDLAGEREFFSERGLPIDAATHEIRLRPGELLVFDNLAVAHGRRGVRRPGELHQRVYGWRQASVARQRAIRDRFLAAFR